MTFYISPTSSLATYALRSATVLATGLRRPDTRLRTVYVTPPTANFVKAVWNIQFYCRRQIYCKKKSQDLYEISNDSDVDTRVDTCSTWFETYGHNLLLSTNTKWIAKATERADRGTQSQRSSHCCSLYALSNVLQV
ncbi:unnamed protein product [Arctia plantaginis]|uniref:Uncharacterized protein n=1 Tax=Arctia plantaginis TaxID=874455 RepID=A0A8S1AYA1_ARCPL|nr:unnamed protein product [Arctia plantaginis]